GANIAFWTLPGLFALGEYTHALPQPLQQLLRGARIACRLGRRLPAPCSDAPSPISRPLVARSKALGIGPPSSRRRLDSLAPVLYLSQFRTAPFDSSFRLAVGRKPDVR